MFVFRQKTNINNNHTDSTWKINNTWLITHQASKGGEYNPEEHVPIKSFVTTLIDWTSFLMTRTKLVFIGFVAARNCVPQQVLDDAKSLHTCGRSHSATTCDSSHAPKSAKYYSIATKVLLQYCSVLQSITKYYPLRCSTKYYSSTSLCYKVLQSTTPVLLCTPIHSILRSATPVLRCSTSTTPALLCATKFYFSTTLFYNSTLFYSTTLQYKVQEIITPVLLRTAKYYYYFSVLQCYTMCKVLLGTTRYYSVPQSTTPLLCTTKCHYGAN